MAMTKRVRWLPVLVLCGLFWPTNADASSSSELQYTLPQVFSGALRYLRVDLGYEVTEKDPESAYLLFRYTPHGKQETAFGAVEIVAMERSVRVTVKLPQLPSYHETLMRDGLLKKLRDDYGAEPRPKAPPSGKKAPPEPEPKPDPDGDAKAPKSKEEPSKPSE